MKILGGASNFVVNNSIGTDTANSATIGNTSHGMWLTGGTAGNQVGNQIPNTGNSIAFNGGAGVWVDPSAGIINLIDPNSNFRNAGLGIDLGEFGQTSNDAGDNDVGPNNLQNYPEITNQSIDANGDLIVSYKVDATPSNSDYGTGGLRIEFFKSDLSGEGEVFFNADSYTVSDYNSLAPGVKTVNLGNATVMGFGTNDRVTATTSDASGNTSEFYPAFVPTAADVTVSGRVLDSAGRGIPHVSVVASDQNGITMRARTNSFGAYRFERLEAGATYYLTVSHPRYAFTVSTQIVLVTDNLDSVDFIAGLP